MTHFAKLRDCADTLRFFHQMVSGLQERLGAVLFQLPPGFKKDAAVLAAFLEEVPTGMRAAFEFRHDSWFDEEVFAALRLRNAALCIADSDKLSTPVVATADFGYLRLRREDYVSSDIARWAETLRGQDANWRDAFVYFKHEESGVGPRFAAEMARLLSGGENAFASRPAVD